MGAPQVGDNFMVHKKSCTLNTILHNSFSQIPSATKVGGGGGRKGRRKKGEESRSIEKMRKEKEEGEEEATDST